MLLYSRVATHYKEKGELWTSHCMVQFTKGLGRILMYILHRDDSILSWLNIHDLYENALAV